MNIRKVETKDADILLKMLKQLDKETNFMLYEDGERKTIIEEMENNIKNTYQANSLMLVAEENKEVVGFLSADRGFANRIKHSAYIVIGILKNHRGKGIGTSLFKELEHWAINNNITRLELTVMDKNEGGIKLYEKMGFEREGIKKKSMIVDGNYVDEYYMGKCLK